MKTGSAYLRGYRSTDISKSKPTCQPPLEQRATGDLDRQDDQTTTETSHRTTGVRRAKHANAADSVAAAGDRRVTPCLPMLPTPYLSALLHVGTHIPRYSSLSLDLSHCKSMSMHKEIIKS